jgi:CubicO group peptidase (beta-lactamase class C family)
MLAGGVPAVASARSSQDTDETTSLASFVEERVQEILDEEDVPGATVAVVEEGTVTLTAGFGVADRGTSRPVTATTPFRIGSLSKPVVWTAIARLLVNDEVDAAVPVSTYLDDDIVSWDDPVTLANLATHTGGFETTNQGLWYPRPSDVESLPSTLETSMAAQVRPPGERGAYSNHGVGVAGQALAAVADQSFADAMDRLLFEPAGMTQSTFQQPLPERIRDPHAVGYGSAHVDGPFAGVGIAPAGAMSSSARDMATFMQLHLQDGVVDGSQVLESAAVESTQRQWFTHDEALSGSTLGFLERRRGGVRALEHSGATLQFCSTMVLAPETETAVFVGFNSDEGQGPIGDLQDELRDQILPAPDAPTPVDDPTPMTALEGTYRGLRRAETTHAALVGSLSTPTISVSSRSGALVVDQIDGRWVEVEPLVFEHVETGRRLAFETVGGEAAYLYVGGVPTALRRERWHESVQGHFAVLLVSLLALLLGAVTLRPSRPPDGSWREWLAATRRDPRRLAKFAGTTGSLAFLAFVGINVTYLYTAQLAYLSDPPLLYRVAFALPITGAIAAIAASVAAIRLSRDGHWRRRWRLLHGITATALLTMTGFLWHWNLLLPP